ncbi:GatB/YqeY domain-containing protein [Caldalkalibacillus mannanilyticus]|uniref:GatB/YqeY domain-containing protein n=1 Tax=Caldalkalibacillus mannanilyticus TaxID=1418 RepID=UPI000469B646|nr:GatB/YqeY domain-containing protein [Caldalkalibacillus mannanilyticus]
MSLLELLNSDMKQAMKDKEKKKLSVIRMLKSSLQNEQINLGRELTEDEMLTVLTREMKQRRDSLQEFQKADRDDLADGVQEEINVLTKYMPQQLSEDEIRQLVAETIAQVGASSKADMGKVMGALMPKVKGKADGALVNKLVQQLLT